MVLGFQSTRPVRGATIVLGLPDDGVVISIHAPRAGRDPRPDWRIIPTLNFNPRAPCGARRFIPAEAEPEDVFQSTRPVRGATTLSNPITINGKFQSTRPVRGATRRPRWRCRPPRNFNPRAPCGARPQEAGAARGRHPEFQSTRPVRGATDGAAALQQINDVFQSTRPVRGATNCIPPLSPMSNYFNPRAPCGARRSQAVQFAGDLDFNPRAPCGARRRDPYQVRGEGDFNPRAPCGARRCAFVCILLFVPISIHAPRAGRDFRHRVFPPFLPYFNPRAPCGARLRQKCRPRA